MISPTSYSADVRIHLIIDDTAYPLAKIGPDVAVLRQPADLPQCEGLIELQIDGKISRWGVRLPHGACPIDENVEIIAVTPNAPGHLN